MELSLILLLLTSLTLCFLLKTLLTFVFAPKLNFPPGPPNIPFFTSFQWFRKGFSQLEPTLRRLHSEHGPIVSLQIGKRKAIFISSHELAHKALITHGSTFADRPLSAVASRYINANQHNINTAAYGSLWRLFRRNLTSEILHPNRVKSYSHASKWVLDILINKLKQESDSGRPVLFIEHFQYAMFCLLVLMCFGDKLEDKTIREVETVQRDLLNNFNNFNLLDVFPVLGKILFRKRWSLVFKVLENQERVLLPLIEARRENMNKEKKNKEETVAYVDTLLNLTLLEEGGRKLTDQELITLCSEFLSAGTDTTSTALQWIMANLVKKNEIQAKLLEEIKAVVCHENEVEEIKEEDLQKMPYLKAVVLEGLRRHPPGHMVLPHTVTESVKLEGYDIPKEGTTVNFMVADMGWDPKVWEDPMEFKPERFMKEGEVFDITGSREIKMMPFGAGRRICPGLGLAMLHLEYFVANLVWKFEWKVENGGEVDLSEKLEFTVVMKHPLRAQLAMRKV